MKHVVWIKITDPESVDYTDGNWEPNCDGPMGPKTAERIAREIKEDFGCHTQVLPEGQQPQDL